MSDSRFYFAPMLADGELCVGASADTADLETITIPAGSTLCEYDPTGDPTVPRSGTGKSYSIAWGRGGTVRIRCDLGNDSDLAEALMAMVSFAREGGVIGFAWDSDQAWAVQLTSDIARGDTDFDYPTNIVEAWEGITDPEVGWRCLAQSPLPQMRREIIELDGVAGGNATLDGSFVFALSVLGWNVLVRPKLFFPFLRYLSGDVVLSEPTGGVYVFDCVFEVDVGLEHTPVAVADALVYFPFEEPTEGTAIVDWTDQGSAAFTTITIPGGLSTMRNTSVVYAGAASCEFDEQQGARFDYGGTAMDLGVHPNAHWRFAYRPRAVPSSFAHTMFCWGDSVDNRFLFALLPTLAVQIYCRVASSTKFNIASGAAQVALNTWSIYEMFQDGAGNVVFRVNGTTIGSGTDGGISWSDATFGNARWGAESWTADNFCHGYMDEFKITVNP